MKPSPCIHELRPARAVDQELEWFFNRAESDMGLRSNFLASLGRHGPGSHAPSPDEAVDASHQQRRIRGWLSAIEDTHTEVLRSAYVQRDWPVVLWDRFGRLTGIVVRLACAHDAVPEGLRAQERFEMNHAAWLAGECHRAAIDPLFIRLRTDAQGRFARATSAYSRARGNVLPLRGRPR
jgi:hypothetical protein